MQTVAEPTTGTRARRSVPVSSELRLDYHQLFAGTPHPMWIFDIETLAFLDVNEVAVRHYGYSKDEFLRMTIKDIRPLEALPRLLAHLPTTRDEPSPEATRWHHRKKDGTVIAVEVNSILLSFAGRPARLVMANDVTEQDNAEAQNRYHAFLLAAITDAVVATDDNLVIKSWNAAAERVYGWKADEVLGRPTHEVIPGEFSDLDRSEAIRWLVDAGRLSGEVTQRRKNGERIHVEVRAVALVDQSGRRIGYVAVNRDITERRRAENTIRALLNAVVAAQEEERSRIARELHDDTAQALTSMIMKLRAMTEAQSLEEVKLSATELRTHAARALDEIQRIARGLRPATLDALGLEAALERLAIEFTQSSKISVDVQCIGLEGKRLPPSVEITLYRIAQESMTNVGKHAAAKTASIVVHRTAARAVLIVEDDGCGFDPSKTSPCGGFGLLGIRERVALMGGTLAIESAHGTGTTVAISIPINDT